VPTIAYSGIKILGNHLIARYRESLLKKVELSKGDLKEYYKGHPQRFALPERYRLAIMVFSDPAKAKAALTRLEAGEPFGTLAEEHVAGGGKASRTRPMPAEAMPEGMREAVTAAPVGDVVQYKGQTAATSSRFSKRSMRKTELRGGRRGCPETSSGASRTKAF